MFAPDAPGELGEGLSNPDMLRRPTMRREVQSTSALEGTFEPLETVLAQDYEVGEDKSGLSESMREVLNYLDAAECGIGQIQSGHPISLPLVRELQKLLVKGHEVRQSTGLLPKHRGILRGRAAEREASCQCAAEVSQSIG